MALDLGDLVGRIVLEDEYTGVIDQADRKTAGFGATAGKVALGVGAAMAAVGLAVAVGVGAVIKAGVEYNAQMSTYETNLGTLLGSAEAAEDQLAQLSSFAASTPFEMPTLADAAQTLLSFGTSADDLMPSLRMLGDISLGNSEKMAGLATVFGQVQSAGRLMGQDVLQMINQGFNPLVEISKMTGESMVELKARMEAGGISFEEVRAAMEHATSAGGQFYNAMANGALTFDGQVSTLTDGLNILAGTITGDFTDALTTGALPAVNEIVSGLVDLVNGVEGADEAVQTGAANLATAISSSVGPAIEGLVSNLGVVLSAIAPVIGQLATTLVASLASVLPSILSVASTLVTTLISAIVTAAPGLITAAVPVIVSLATGLLAQLPLILDAAMQIVVELARGITDALPELLPAAIGAIVGLVTTLVDNMPMVLDAAMQLVLGLAEGLIAALPDLIAQLPAIILGIVDYLIGAIPLLIETGIQLLISLVEALPEIIQAIVAAIPKIITGIVTAVVGAIPRLIEAGVELLIALVENLPVIISTIIQAVPQIITSLVGAFTSPEMIGKMASAGGAIIEGLWNGLKSMWNSVVRWFENTVGGLIDGFKDMFGIHSPSTVFRGFGVNIMEGLVLGLDDKQMAVDHRIEEMAQPLLAVGSAGASTVTNYTTGPTYVVNMEANRSVLDQEAIYQALGSPRIEDN